MSRLTPLPFQEEHIEALLARLDNLRQQYERLGADPDRGLLKKLRRQEACIMLQAPTGIGKTLIMCETLNRFSATERMLWFWFAPFAGVISQAQRALQRQAPRLPQLEIDGGRRPERLEPGAVFVLTWQTVAARSRDSRLARQRSDAGLALDDLVSIARDLGLKIGVVVDEAHHGFIRAPVACDFFSKVLSPDYVLMMTATPRDQDAEQFAEKTGYHIGGPDEWASITRSEGVEAQLLKRSVKAIRFVAKNQDEEQLVSFEQVALAECAAMHCRLAKLLREHQIPLVPLMLVQVPNGGAALNRAREYLIDTVHFSPNAVKTHTADEPDPDLAAMADDPAVEVILFKMAIATGFDAPRAFTLAALRGTRDINFGIQVVGRIMRVHQLLQGRLDSVARELAYGYVFLANSEAQEGLVGAAADINQIPDHLVSACTSTVVTISADRIGVQSVREGQNLVLPMEQTAIKAAQGALKTATQDALDTQLLLLFTDLLSSHKGDRKAGELFVHDLTAQSRLTEMLTLDAQSAARQYKLRPGMPTVLSTEFLPELSDDFEEELTVHIEFSSKVLGDRLRVNSALRERTTDVFEDQELEDRDIWARVSPELIAEKAQQLLFNFEGVDRRLFNDAIRKRFRQKLADCGHELPATDEELSQELELVIVRNPNIVRDAYKRIRSERVTVVNVHLRAALESEVDLELAAKNIYGVFPPDLNKPELKLAQMLDKAEEVTWWHRNPEKKPDSVGLYAWHNGDGFFPDFVVKLNGRDEGEGIALIEYKGPHLRLHDRLKAGAVHKRYGRVFYVSQVGPKGPLRLWSLKGDTLADDGPFEVLRLRFG